MSVIKYISAIGFSKVFLSTIFWIFWIKFNLILGMVRLWLFVAWHHIERDIPYCYSKCVRLSVRPSVRHKLVLCQNGWTLAYQQTICQALPNSRKGALNDVDVCLSVCLCACRLLSLATVRSKYYFNCILNRTRSGRELFDRPSYTHIFTCCCSCWCWLMMMNYSMFVAQVLVIAEKSCDITAQQYAFNRLASLPALPFHPHLCAARHAAVRRRVSALDLSDQVQLKDNLTRISDGHWSLHHRLRSLSYYAASLGGRTKCCTCIPHPSVPPSPASDFSETGKPYNLLILWKHSAGQKWLRA